MTGKKAGNNKFLKKYNEARILEIIRIKKEASRAELSQITGLSPTAIGGIVSGLIKKDFICETGTGESKGGRRPVVLKLKPDSYFSIGIDVDSSYINTVLIDITGKIIYEFSTKPNSDADLCDVVQYIKKSVEAVTKKLHIDKNRVLGLGISVPGLVDVKTKRVVLAPNLGWNDADILSEMSKSYSMPVYIENESMASAIYENWMGACREEKNFICINIESGIGAGIFAGGELYRGSGGSAGEVGHIQVDENGPKCGCGNYGCLETVASVKSMVEKAKKFVRQGTISFLNSFENADDITFDSIVDAARKGDNISISILNEAARYIGIAISTLVNTLNPSRIVIGKEFVKYADLVMDTINDVVKHKALKFPAAMADIVASEAGKESSSYGAAIIPLKVLFGK